MGAIGNRAPSHLSSTTPLNKRPTRVGALTKGRCGVADGVAALQRHGEKEGERPDQIPLPAAAGLKARSKPWRHFNAGMTSCGGSWLA